MKYNFNKIGERIKTLRKSRKLSQDSFLEILRDNFGFGISRNTLSLIENGNQTALTFDFLYKASKIFDCDIGFLLGEYEEKTKDVHDICSVTGLSESAIENLMLWSKADDRRQKWGQYISSIIDAEQSEELLGNISEIMGLTKMERKAIDSNLPSLASEMIDLQTAQQWYISKVFSNIIDEMCLEERTKGGASNG